MPGVVVAGMPTIGLVVFDRATGSTPSLELRAVDLRIGEDVVSFSATYAPPWLAYESETAARAPSARQFADGWLRKLDEERRAAEAARVNALAAEAMREAAERRKRDARILLIVGAFVAALFACGAISMCASPDDSAPAKRTQPKPAAPKPRR
jgi:hypothetical protein